MTRNELKELLLKIKEDKFAPLRGEQTYIVAKKMMDYIGDEESELRDGLIYTTLFHWITKGALTSEESKTILLIALDEDHLFKGMGQVSKDVLTRTFSVLIVAICLYHHRKENYLSADELDLVARRLIRFYKEDHDVRGYIEGLGWAHGAAHGADALDELVQCEGLQQGRIEEILEGVYQKVTLSDYGYIHMEDERITTLILSMLEASRITEEDLIKWLETFKALPKRNQLPDDLVLEANAGNFLRSLYFRLLWQEKHEAITSTIAKVLEKNNRFNA